MAACCADQFLECAFTDRLQARALDFCFADVAIQLSELRGLAAGLCNPQIFLIVDKLLARAADVGAQLAVIQIYKGLAFFYGLAFRGAESWSRGSEPASAFRMA